MKIEIAIDTLQAMIERAQGNLTAIPEDDEIEALQRAIDGLTTALSRREAEIDRAVHMIREIGGWPDKDGTEVWAFLRDKIRFSEDEKLEIESRLGIR
jgi:predicted  nucleic acid-binding Zn-ribbon protein